MANNIFVLENPENVDLYLRKTGQVEGGTIGKLRVYQDQNQMFADGIVLVTARLSKKITDETSRNVRGLFDIKFKKQSSSACELLGCSGYKRESFLLGGKRMANVYFKQPCIRQEAPSDTLPSFPTGTNLANTVNVEPPDKLVKCPVVPPDNPQLGDVYYDEETGQIKILLSHGWSHTHYKLESAPYIEGSSRILYPNNLTVFVCSPEGDRKWHRDNIDSRRAKKVLKIKNIKEGK